jgi:hypothetical protein
MPVQPRIRVEGIKEFQQAVRKSVDKDLGKRLGQANKRIGELVIAKLKPAPTPAAVGAGAGATVRPSASRRDVLLRVGGKHRASASLAGTRRRQWGKRRVAGSPGRNSRPYILESALDNREEIEQEWLKAVADALSPAFNKTEP